MSARPGDVPAADDTTALAISVRFDAAGLVPAIVQEATTRDVLMVGYMNKEALRLTLETRRTWFFSRSRQELWQKGETSGNRQHVRKVFVDCDADALVIEVEQVGSGACHTGSWTCFERRLDEEPGER